MLGDMPCLEATEDCMTRLQQLVIQNSRELKAIDQRIEAIRLPLPMNQCGKLATCIQQSRHIQEAMEL